MLLHHTEFRCSKILTLLKTFQEYFALYLTSRALQQTIADYIPSVTIYYRNSGRPAQAKTHNCDGRLLTKTTFLESQINDSTSLMNTYTK